MAKEGITGKSEIYKHYKKICDLGWGMTREVISNWLWRDDPWKGVGHDLREYCQSTQAIKDGVKALVEFTNWTSKQIAHWFFSRQAILAAKAGATHVSPFIDVSMIPDGTACSLSPIFMIFIPAGLWYRNTCSFHSKWFVHCRCSQSRSGCCHMSTGCNNVAQASSYGYWFGKVSRLITPKPLVRPFYYTSLNFLTSEAKEVIHSVKNNELLLPDRHWPFAK